MIGGINSSWSTWYFDIGHTDKRYISESQVIDTEVKLNINMSRIVFLSVETCSS